MESGLGMSDKIPSHDFGCFLYLFSSKETPYTTSTVVFRTTVIRSCPWSIMQNQIPWGQSCPLADIFCCQARENQNLRGIQSSTHKLDIKQYGRTGNPIGSFFGRYWIRRQFLADQTHYPSIWNRINGRIPTCKAWVIEKVAKNFEDVIIVTEFYNSDQIHLLGTLVFALL